MPGMARISDIWAGTCTIGHSAPPTPPGFPLSVSGIIIGTAATCLANNLAKAKVGVDLAISGCGHAALIVTGATTCFSEGAPQATITSVVTSPGITGIIVSGSGDCIAN